MFAIALLLPVLAAQQALAATPEPLAPAQVYDMLEKAMQVHSGQAYFKDAKFAGSQACAECHPRAVEDWHKTWHSKMEQWATPETVLGEFDGQVITYSKVKALDADGREQEVTFQVRVHRDGDKFFYTVLDKDDPANNQTWQIAKTLGGKWDQGYEVKVGDNYYAALLRYSVKNQGWLIRQFAPEEWVIADGTPDGRPRKPHELIKSRTAEAKCQGCHTTGFQYRKDAAAGVIKSSAEPGGTAELGVACEQCHGPASRHVDAAKVALAAGRPLAPADRHIVHMLKDLDFQQQTQVCGTCHGRGTNKVDAELAFPLGFRPGDRDLTDRHRMWSYTGTSNPREVRYFYSNDWAKRNRQQWQDFTKSKHYNKAEMSCLTCHSFHGKAEDAQLRQQPQPLCQGCHTATADAKQQPNVEMYEGSPMQKAGVTCINCHMPRIAFRTTETSSTKRLTGDGSSHTFMTATPYLKMAAGLRSACEACHTKGVEMTEDIESWVGQKPLTNEQLIAKMEAVKIEVRARMDKVQRALVGWEPATLQAVALVEQAKGRLNFVLRDGSGGAHNSQKALAMLDEAFALVVEARSGQPPSPAVMAYQKTLPEPATAALPPRPAATPVAVVAPVPAATQTTQVGARSETPKPETWYVVRPGDSLSTIARRAYGAQSAHSAISVANRKLLADPTAVMPGMLIYLPATPPYARKYSAEEGRK